MILYYALGGGLGHLTRARAFFHTRPPGDRLAVLTASPAARDPRVVGDWEILPVPAHLARDPAACGAWLRALVLDARPSALYVDSFPGGIVGDLTDGVLPAGIPVYHLARLLRWPEYRALAPGPGPRFTRTYLLEPLAPAHEAFLRERSAEILPLVLRDPPAILPPEAVAALERRTPGGRPLWSVVHAGPAEEVAELLAYTRELARAERLDPALVLVAPACPPGLSPEVLHLDLYPAWPLFARSARVVTACGFNVMRQAAPWRERHRFVPFPRRFDDQFARAARVRGLSPPTPAGRRVSSRGARRACRAPSRAPG